MRVARGRASGATRGCQPSKRLKGAAHAPDAHRAVGRPLRAARSTQLRAHKRQTQAVCRGLAAQGAQGVTARAPCALGGRPPAASDMPTQASVGSVNWGGSQRGSRKAGRVPGAHFKALVFSHHDLAQIQARDARLHLAAEAGRQVPDWQRIRRVAPRAAARGCQPKGLNGQRTRGMRT